MCTHDKKMGVFAVTGMLAAMMATGVLAEDLTKEDVSGLWYITTMEIEGMNMSPDNLSLNLQDTGLLKNIDYIDSEEEGAEPEPNSIVYFEKAE